MQIQTANAIAVLGFTGLKAQSIQLAFVASLSIYLLVKTPFPARDLPSATGCLQIASARSGVCGLLVSREDAKTRRKRRGDVEPRMDTNGHKCRYLGLSSPRSALCNWLPADCRCGEGGLQAVGLTRRREDAKGKAEVVVWCSSRVSGKCLTARTDAARAV